MRTYFDHNDANDSYKLTDLEVFLVDAFSDEFDNDLLSEFGWYWWSCFPGCIPDSDPSGPFYSLLDALVDARQDVEQDLNDLVVWYVVRTAHNRIHYLPFPPNADGSVILSYVVTYPDVDGQDIEVYWLAKTTENNKIDPIYYAF